MELQLRLQILNLSLEIYHFYFKAFALVLLLGQALRRLLLIVTDLLGKLIQNLVRVLLVGHSGAVYVLVVEEPVDANHLELQAEKKLVHLGGWLLDDHRLAAQLHRLPVFLPPAGADAADIGDTGAFLHPFLGALGLLLVGL